MAKRKPLDWRELVEEQKLIAMLRTDDESRALGAARAAVAGGIKILEITLNTPGALNVIRALRREKILLGAGSVRTVKAAKAALKAGARFIVSPHFDRRIVTFVNRRGLLAVAGAATPTEMLAARERGAGLIKVFPAQFLGGAEYIKALLAPLPDLPLVAVGGVNMKNIKDYLGAGVKAVGVGSSSIFKRELLVSKNFKGISSAAEHLLEVVQAETYSPRRKGRSKHGKER